MIWRGKSFRNRRKPIKTKAIIYLFIFFISILVPIYIFELKVHNIMIQLSHHEVKRIAQESVTKALDEVRQSMQTDLNQILIVEKSNDGKISSIQLNTAIEMELYSKLAAKMQHELKNIEKKPIQLKMGEIFQSSLLSDYGPTINLKICPEGAAKISLKPKMEAKGINMVSISLNAEIHHDISVMVPFVKETFPIEYDYPVAQRLIVGEVPAYYCNSDDQFKKAVIPTP